MDKEFLERVSVGIQLLGYGLIYYSLFYVGRYGSPVIYYYKRYGIDSAYDNSARGQIFFMIMCFVVPIIIRWMLTGKFKVLPFVTKDD